LYEVGNPLHTRLKLNGRRPVYLHFPPPPNVRGELSFSSNSQSGNIDEEKPYSGLLHRPRSSPSHFQMSFEAPASVNSSEPEAKYMSSSCLDFLLIELVPMAERIASEISGLDESQDAVFYRLESLGYRVGQGLTER
jgi:hypothetical protein